MATDNLDKTQEAIDAVLDGGQEYQSGRKRVRRPELNSLHQREIYFEKKEAQAAGGSYPGRFRANFNNTGNT